MKKEFKLLDLKSWENLRRRELCELEPGKKEEWKEGRRKIGRKEINPAQLWD